MKRLTLVKMVIALVAAVFVVGGSYASGNYSAAGNVGIHDGGVGIYTDASTANQSSTFTLSPTLVSCGVGTLNLDGSAGPFEMLMYSATVNTYTVDKMTKTIRATGKMRSITRMSGKIVEDTDGTGLNPALHDYVAIAIDSTTGGPDRYDLHMRTPFWNSTNPMCAVSNVIPGGCRFGGNLMLGGVEVGM